MKTLLLGIIGFGLLSSSLFATIPPVTDPMDGRWPPVARTIPPVTDPMDGRWPPMVASLVHFN